MEAGRASPHRDLSTALGTGLGPCPATGELCVLLKVPSLSCAGLPNRLPGSKEHRLCLGRCRCWVTRCFQQSCEQLVWRWRGALDEVRDTGWLPPGPAASAPRSLLNVHLVSERWEPPWVSAAEALSPPMPRPHPGSVGQDKYGPGGLGRVPEPGHGQGWGRVREGVAVQSPQITKAKSVPGKLAPNDRLEPRDRGQAACPCPLWAQRLGGSGEGPEHGGLGGGGVLLPSTRGKGLLQLQGL